MFNVGVCFIEVSTIMSRFLFDSGSGNHIEGVELVSSLGIFTGILEA